MDGYRIDAENGIIYGKRGRPLRRVNGRGYAEVVSNGRLIALSHRAIWESVHGSIPDGLEINHINGVKTDNRISNLELVTASENKLHAYAIGLQRADGRNNGRYKHGRYMKEKQP